MIPIALVLVSMFTFFTSPVAASNEINLDEIPSGVAVSNSGQTVVGLANLRRGIIVKTNGSTTAFDVQCSISDVEVNPTATRGWSICNDSTYLTVLALTTGEISAMDTKVSNAFDIEFSDSGKLLVVLGGSGQLGIISVRSDADYELKSVSVGESAAGLALSRNGRQAFVSTDSGKLIVVDTRSGRIQKFPIRLQGYQQVYLGSLALHPSGRFLFASGYATKKDASSYTAVILALNPSNGKTISSTTIAVDSTTIDLAVTTNNLYAGLGLSVVLPSGSTGLLQFSINQRGELDSPRAATTGSVIVSELELSANQRHLAVTTINSKLLRLAA
jgi:hypothetical protein